MISLRHFARPRMSILAVFGCLAGGVLSVRAAASSSLTFARDVQPVLAEYCYDCHGDGMNKGSVSFDDFKSEKAVLEDKELWWRAYRNLRAGLMPPAHKPRPSAEETERIKSWIKSSVFEIDPDDPDPGRVTVRRLNRVEYRNTIRDLMGVDFNTDAEFPPDDTGHGFDNIGDVLTLPAMLLEKYLNAAKTIVSKAVPAVPGVPPEHVIPGRQFRDLSSTNDQVGSGALSLSYYKPATVSCDFKSKYQGRYQVVLDLTANERYVDNQFDYNKCQLVLKIDGEAVLRQEFNREGGRSFQLDVTRDWAAERHEFVLEVTPLTPEQKQVRSLSLRINSVTVRGPLEEAYWVPPKNHARFFGERVPSSVAERRSYARTLLEKFARKAYRRPVDARTLDRLADLAEKTYQQPGQTFEAGVAQAMVAVLASPRFLFREEGIEPAGGDERFPWVDEYSLASRLSYFLWSSMPDDELFRLADQNKLRENLPAQLKRMLADPRSQALIKNFVGQWLQARDIESVQIDARAVLNREDRADPDLEKKRRRFRELRDNEDNLNAGEKEELANLRRTLFRGFRAPRADLTGDLRRDMRQETEMMFDYVLRQDRPLLDLIDCDYTFLNERLAKHYGISGVQGDQMRRVLLPADSPRGGILTQGTVLAVTSNPTRTSPVKRGVFVLDNLLGMPPPPPPPDIPPLEDSSKGFKDRTPTLRETLALHRSKPLCSSCHDRMDPLGLALENFNAMGMWRDKERDQPIDATGKLVTGEAFSNIRELKRALVVSRATDFYRTLTEKLLTYALGRGLEYTDVIAVEQIVDRLQLDGGHPSALMMGVVQSAPFEKTRRVLSEQTKKTIQPVRQTADARTKS